MEEKEKQRIDYEIKAKREDKEKAFAEWVVAFYVAIIIVLLLVALFHVIF